MGFLPAVVGVQDSSGNRIDQEDINGQRAPIILAVGDGLSGVQAANGSTQKVTITASTLLKPFKTYIHGIAGIHQTAQTSGDEKGAIVFNPSDFFAGNSQVARTITFIAVLECAAAGQTCALALFNITDGTTVTTLSTGNTSPTLVTTTLLVGALSGQLPNSQKLYGLRLTRTGGGTTDLVTCKLARLEVSYT